MRYAELLEAREPRTRLERPEEQPREDLLRFTSHLVSAIRWKHGGEWRLARSVRAVREAFAGRYRPMVMQSFSSDNQTQPRSSIPTRFTRSFPHPPHSPTHFHSCRSMCAGGWAGGHGGTGVGIASGAAMAAGGAGKGDA